MMKLGITSVVVLLSVNLVSYSEAFKSPILSICRQRNVLCMADVDEDVKKSQRSKKDLNTKLEIEDYQGALNVIKRDPLINLNLDDVIPLLNNLDKIEDYSKAVEPGKEGKKTMEAGSLIYRRLERLNSLKGFNCIRNAYPEKLKDISPMKLEEITGLSIGALTPKQRNILFRPEIFALWFVEYAFGSFLGIDPLFVLLPLTFGGILIDSLFYKGAFYESIYRKLSPDYEKKVICHEAGHFLVAYLLGLAVVGCYTNAWEARKYPQIQGQAGTLFYDAKLEEEIANQKITRNSLDRLSVVLMAGIAAEAQKFGTAEGGYFDEQGLFKLFAPVQPAWNILRIQGQARWAAVQALLLIREHQAAYDALVETLSKGGQIGDCIEAIEANLPAELPSKQRIQAMEMERVQRDNDAIMGYVKRMTYKVGGIEPLDETDPELARAVTKEGYLNSTSSVKTVKSVAATAPSPNIISPRSSDETSSSIENFAQSIKLLEDAAKRGDIEVSKKQQGGIWLNNLKSYREGMQAEQSETEKFIETFREDASEDMSNTNTSTDDLLTSSQATDFGFSRDIIIPPPLEGYEERIARLENEGRDSQESPTAEVRETSTSFQDMILSDITTLSKASTHDESEDIASPQKTYDSTTPIRNDIVKELLASHRGFMMKKLEIQELWKRNKIVEITKRIDEIKANKNTLTDVKLPEAKQNNMV